MYEWSEIRHIWYAGKGGPIIVGYIVVDSDCCNPCESCDGMGKIKQNNFMAFIGRTPDGTPNIEAFVDTLQRIRGTDDVDDEIINTAYSIWTEAYKYGKVGEPYAVPLERKHSTYHEADGSDPDASIDGVWRPDKYALEHINSFPEAERRAKAHELFECVLAEYNKWINGECYGAVVEVFERVNGTYVRIEDKGESCWGFIGIEPALEELLCYFNGAKRTLANPR